MKIKYEFADGTINEVEVPDDIGKFIAISRRDEENLARKERYHSRVSLDALEYEGADFADHITPVTAFNEQEEQERVNAFIDTLTDVQRRRLLMKLEDPSMSLREIARREGVDIKTVRDSFAQIQSKYAKFFNVEPPQKR